jgi:hypothetical protein
MFINPRKSLPMSKKAKKFKKISKEKLIPKPAELPTESKRKRMVHSDGTPYTEVEIQKKELIELMKNLKV